MQTPVRNSRTSTDEVTNLKTNKSPGLDGPTNEFYQCFRNGIKELFYGALNWFLKMIFFHKEPQLSLFYIRKQWNKSKKKDYRLNSLTNTDY